MNKSSSVPAGRSSRAHSPAAVVFERIPLRAGGSAPPDERVTTIGHREGRFNREDERR